MKSMALISTLRGGFFLDTISSEIMKLCVGGTLVALACVHALIHVSNVKTLSEKVPTFKLSPVANSDTVDFKIVPVVDSDMDDVKFVMGKQIILGLDLLVVAEVIQIFARGLDSTLYLIAIVMLRNQLGNEMSVLEKKVTKNGNKKHH